MAVNYTLHLIVLFVGLLTAVLTNIYFILTCLNYSKKYFGEIHIYFKSLLLFAVFMGILEIFFFFSRLFFAVNQIIFPVVSVYFDIFALVFLVMITFAEFGFLNAIKKMENIYLKVK